MNLSRRTVLHGVGALTAGALLPRLGFAQGAPWWQRIDAARAAVGNATPQDGGVSLDLPLVSEDGSAVQLGITVQSPMSEASHVREIHLFAARNPSPEIAVLKLTPTLGRAQVTTRVRLAESQTVGAVAKMSDGTVRVASREVRITTSGCFVRADTGTADEMTPRVRVPGVIAARTPAEVLTMISHPMETGLRADASGAIVPHRIVKSFVATIDDRPVFEAELFRSVAANPYFRFFIQPTRSTAIEFAWTEETGRRASARAAFTVG